MRSKKYRDLHIQILKENIRHELALSIGYAGALIDENRALEVQRTQAYKHNKAYAR